MAQDLKFTTDNDIDILNGDFVIDEVENQHIEHLLLASKGNYYQSPTVGVGIIKYLNSPSTRAGINQDIRIELTKDGYKNIQFKDNKVTATRK